MVVDGPQQDFAKFSVESCDLTFILTEPHWLQNVENRYWDEAKVEKGDLLEACCDNTYQRWF